MPRLISAATSALLALLAYALPPCAAFAQSDGSTLTPLTDFMKDNDVAKDPAAVEYIAVRCAGFYTAGAAAMDAETNPDIIALKNTDLKLAASFLALATELDMKRTKKSKEEAAQVVRAGHDVVWHAYLDKMQSDKTPDDIGRDPVFTEDAKVCRTLSAHQLEKH